MTERFLQILNMSLSSTWLVLAVLLIRFALKKAPKWVNVLLWGLVALRLVCPFTLESALSLIPSAEVVSPEIMVDPTPTIHTGIDAVNRVVNPVITESFAPEPAASANPLQIWIPIASAVWCIGMVLMLLYTIVSCARLRYRVRMAIRAKGNIYLSESVSSPFVLGVFNPRIYLPYHMEETDRKHVIAHERAHIRRKDHLWKPLGFLLLSIHWFNPFLWLAYILLCRDIELACDEKVIKELGSNQRADYSQALLHCSIAHRSIAACPIAFGEVGVKQRVKNVLNYKKPAFWVTLISILLCIIVAVCFLTDPLTEAEDPYLLIQRVIGQDGYEITGQESKNINLVIQKDWLSEDCFSQKGHTFEEKERIPYQTFADNILYLKHVGYSDESEEYLRFTFDFVTGSLEKGKLLLPYYVDIEGNGFQCNVTVNRGEVWDNRETYENAAVFQPVTNGEGMIIDVKAEICKNAGHHIAFMLTDLNELTYAEADPDLPITMTIQFVDRTQAHLVFQYSGDLSQEEIQIGEAYTLEQLVNGSWEELPRLLESQGSQLVVDVENAGYDAWTLPDWSEVYGRLPDGTYRIKKDVTLTDDSGNTQTYPLSAEFTISGTAEDYITYTLEDITPTGAVLHAQETLEEPMNLVYNGDEGFWLECWQAGQWVYLEPTGYIEPMFADKPCYIHEYISSGKTELDWSALYGELPFGTYRIAREVTYVDGSTAQVCTAYAEFTIGPDWGIDLMIDRITEAGITVNLLLDENMPEGEYFFAGSTLQVKERFSWKDIIPLPESDPPADRDIVSEASGCSFLWDEDLYQLTEGEHRVGIRIKHILPDGTEEYNILYEYFDPSAYAWGRALDVTLVSNTDREIYISYDKIGTIDFPEGSLTEDYLFGLQKRENNQWIDMECKYDFSDRADFDKHNAGICSGSVNLSAYFGDLSNGTYRLVQDYTRHYSDGTTDTRSVYAVFTIDS